MISLHSLFKDFADVKNIPDKEIGFIACNSSRVTKESVFVCIEGTVTDGHKFAEDAYNKGAAAIVCSRDIGYENQIIVENTRKAYAVLCAKLFDSPAEKLKLIGITGTNGKTTVTYLLKHILEQNGKKTGLIGTICNMIGDKEYPTENTTPDAYELQRLLAQMVKEGCEYAVMEVSSHALEQERVTGCRFLAGVFTNLSQDHLDYHKTMESYKEAKKKLFEMSEISVVNIDDPCASDMTEGTSGKVVTYSINSDYSDYTAKNIKLRPDKVVFEMLGFGVIARIKLHIPGQFSVYNAMAAASAALAIGIPFTEVTAALSDARGVKGRVEVVKTDRDFTILIDYAHTPDGLVNVLNTMRAVSDGRIVVLFGCGGDRDKTKRPLMGKVCAEIADLCIVTSDNPRSENPTEIISDILEGMKGCKTKKKVIENRYDAIKYAIENARSGDIIILAGKGHETYQILNEGTIHFDEREVVREILETV